MILSFINIRKVPRDFALGFQHFPRDLANVNEWKIMFDPSIVRQVFIPIMCEKSINSGKPFARN